MDAISDSSVDSLKVNGVKDLASSKDKDSGLEEVEPRAISDATSAANHVEASVENGDHEYANNFNHARDSEELNYVGQTEASYGSEVQDDVDEAEQVETSNEIEGSDRSVDNDVIKDERDADTYPDYEMIKKEEPDDDQIDKKLPELGEITDMFDDVDAPEYVDLDYEGIAEVDGVDCFVCEGQS